MWPRQHDGRPELALGQVEHAAGGADAAAAVDATGVVVAEALVAWVLRGGAEHVGGGNESGERFAQQFLF